MIKRVTNKREINWINFSFAGSLRVADQLVRRTAFVSAAVKKDDKSSAKFITTCLLLGIVYEDNFEVKTLSAAQYGVKFCNYVSTS